MTTNLPAALIPTVTFARHAAPADWTPLQRSELAQRLGKLGSSISELSDARERLGFPRLSEGSTWDREHAHENLESPEIQAAIAQLRIEHTALVCDIGRSDRDAVREARRILRLRAGWALRIAELRALYAQVRILEILAETPRTVRPVETRPTWSEAELFAGAEAL